MTKIRKTYKNYIIGKRIKIIKVGKHTKTKLIANDNIGHNKFDINVKLL